MPVFVPPIVFEPARDIEDLSGKVILVTGGNTGLGKETVLQLAKHNPAEILLAARNETKSEEAIKDIKSKVSDANVTFLKLDLTSFDSIRAAAETFKKSHNRLDVLINNAGIMACPADKTAEGYEIQFGTNHVGHAMLTKCLMPVLEKTASEADADVRIINVSSAGEKWSVKNGLALDDVKTDMHNFSTWQRYGQSKLANVLWSNEFAKRHPSIKSIVIHPGVVRTELGRGPMASFPLFKVPISMMLRMVTVPVATGVLNQLWAATSEFAITGTFYYPVGRKNNGSANAQNQQLAEQLWDWTENELAAHSK